MDRTITVRGTASASLRPDRAELELYLESEAPDYGAASAKAAQDEQALRRALEKTGLCADDLLTRSYSVDVRYEQQRAADGASASVFKGYACSHTLCLRFALESRRLQSVLDALAGCAAKPRFEIAFTVADTGAATDGLLAAACADARRTAQTLATASGARLGALLHIERGAVGNAFRSPSNAAFGAGVMTMRAAAPELRAQDVEVRDEATFTWALEQA